MLGRFPPIPQASYPHMLALDAELFTLFLLKHGTEYLRFDYDLPVGSGIDPGPDLPVYLRDDFIHLTRKKIDAVGYTSSGVDIIEVKPRAGLTALGQLIAYRDLFKLSYPQFAILKLILITTQINADEILVYEKNGITILTF